MASSLANIGSVGAMFSDFAKMDKYFGDEENIMEKDKKKKNKKKEPDQPPTNLHEAASQDSLASAMLFWAQGHDVNGRIDGSQTTPLHWACYKGSLPIVKFLLERGADVNATERQQQSPLMWACIEGHIEVVSYLLDSGANALLEDSRGCNAHCISAQNQQAGIVHMLMTRQPCDVNHCDNDGHPMLCWAAYKGDLCCAKYLVEVHNADVKIVDKQKRSFLHWAAREGHEEVCAYLLGLGLSATQVDDDNFTPLQHATDRHHLHAADVIRRHQTSRTDYLYSTLGGMVKSRRFLLHTLLGIVFVLCHFLLTHWLPTLLLMVPQSVYLSKNIIGTFWVKTPVVNHRPAKQLLEDVPVPKSLAGACQGGAELRRRAPENVGIFFLFLALQYYFLTRVGIVPSFMYLTFTFGVLIFAALVKLRQFHDVLPLGTTESYPLWKAIDNKEFAEAVSPRIYRDDQLMKVPLRAFYCHEIDRVIKRYDGWTLFLDAPISFVNHRWYFFFILSLAAQQLIVLTTSWSYFKGEFCDKEAAAPFSITRALWSIVFHALPCKDTSMQDLSKFGWTDGKYYQHKLVPTVANAAGVYLIWFGAFFLMIAATTTWRQIQAAMVGATRMEMINPWALCTQGGMTSIFRAGGTVYSEGSPFQNLMLFITGKNGERWIGAAAIPPGAPEAKSCGKGGCGCN